MVPLPQAPFSCGALLASVSPVCRQQDSVTLEMQPSVVLVLMMWQIWSRMVHMGNLTSKFSDGG